MWDIQPATFTELSPKGQFTVRATVRKSLSQFLDRGDMKLEIADNLNGQTIVVAKENMGGMFVGKDALAVLWHPDGRRFAFIYANSESASVSCNIYRLQQKPLGARETQERRWVWVKNELSRRVQHGNPEQRTQAKELLQMMWADW
jgi:hypothetical protein